MSAAAFGRSPRFDRARPGQKAEIEDMKFPRLGKLAPGGFWTDQSGATAIEYAGLLAILGVVILTSVTLLGKNLGALLDSITAAFTNMGF